MSDEEGGAAAASGADGDSQFLVHQGPDPHARYPVRVLYCDGKSPGHCSTDSPFHTKGNRSVFYTVMLSHCSFDPCHSDVSNTVNMVKVEMFAWNFISLISRFFLKSQN